MKRTTMVIMFIAILLLLLPMSVLADDWQPRDPSAANVFYDGSSGFFWDNRTTQIQEQLTHDGWVNYCYTETVPLLQRSAYLATQYCESGSWDANDENWWYCGVRGTGTFLSQMHAPHTFNGNKPTPWFDDYWLAPDHRTCQQDRVITDDKNAYMDYASYHCSGYSKSQCMSPLWALGFGIGTDGYTSCYDPDEPWAAQVKALLITPGPVSREIRPHNTKNPNGLHVVGGGLGVNHWETRGWEDIYEDGLSGEGFGVKHMVGRSVAYNCGRVNTPAIYLTPNSDYTAPRFLPVIGGAKNASNNCWTEAYYYMISPDCGDLDSPFPPSCIAVDGTPSQYMPTALRGSNDTTSYYCPDTAGDKCGNGMLGYEVSIDTNIRPLVPAIVSSMGNIYLPPVWIYPSKYAPDTDTPIARTYWPMPDNLIEYPSRWMTAWHTSVHRQYDGIEFGVGSSVEEARQSVTDHPAAMKYAAKESGSMVPLDVRAIAGNFTDTGNDGVTITDPVSGDEWALSSSPELEYGKEYQVTVRYQTSEGPDNDGRGGIAVWASDSEVNGSPEYRLLYIQNHLVYANGEGDKVITFNYTPRLGVTFGGLANQAFLRVIYHNNDVPVSDVYPTSTGYEPYVCATGSCVGQPDVSTAAEPLVLGKTPATGEIEDYHFTISPILIVSGHLYEMPRGTLPGNTPTTPLGNTPITITRYFTVAAPEAENVYADANGYFYAEYPADNYTEVRITAAPFVEDLSLYEVLYGESRTDNRPTYVLTRSLRYANYIYTFGDELVTGRYDYNDFGYGSTTVSGNYYELISGNGLPAEPVTVTARACYYTMAGELTCPYDLGTRNASTAVDGSFAFSLGKYDSGYTYLIRKLTLSYPSTVAGVLEYQSHLPGTPPGVITSTPPSTVLIIGPGEFTNWTDNNVYYMKLTVDIMRKWPVIPPKPDALTRLLPDPRRQVVTTTIKYFDGVGWSPYIDNCASVVLFQNIDSHLSEPRYFLDTCDDTLSSCSDDYHVNDGLCVSEYTYYATSTMWSGDDNRTCMLPYLIFASAPESDYSVMARWTTTITDTDGTLIPVQLDTSVVGWRVVSLASPINEH